MDSITAVSDVLKVQISRLDQERERLVDALDALEPIAEAEAEEKPAPAKEETKKPVVTQEMRKEQLERAVQEQGVEEFDVRFANDNAWHIERASAHRMMNKLLDSGDIVLTRKGEGKKGHKFFKLSTVWEELTPTFPPSTDMPEEPKPTEDPEDLEEVEVKPKSPELPEDPEAGTGGPTSMIH